MCGEEVLRMGESLFLRADLLIDGESPEPLHDACVRVDGGRVTDLGPASSFGTDADGAESVAVLMPGLVDSHAHVTLPSDRRGWPAGLAPGDLISRPAIRGGTSQAGEPPQAQTPPGVALITDIEPDVAIAIPNATRAVV